MNDYARDEVEIMDSLLKETEKHKNAETSGSKGKRRYVYTNPRSVEYKDRRGYKHLKKYSPTSQNRGSKADAFHLWLSLNKFSHRLKEFFGKSPNRTRVLTLIGDEKLRLMKQCEKSPDIGASTQKENQELEEALDRIEQDLDKPDWFANLEEFLNEL